MTQLAAPISTYQFRPLAPLVYVRRAVDGGAVLDGADRSGWVLDDALRCDSVTHYKGGRVAEASFTYIPLPPQSDLGFEQMLSYYSTDDQVSVVIPPVEDASAQDTGDPGSGTLIFEGVLSRHPFTAQADGGRDIESARMAAFALPTLPELYPATMLWYRWMADAFATTEGGEGVEGGQATPIIQGESIALPVVFNFRGRPNRDATNAITTPITQFSGMAGSPFTHDDDPRGAYWTVRDAIRSVLIYWVLGTADRGAVSRFIDIDRELIAVLSGEGEETGYNGRYAGINDRLPETKVHGLGPLGALQAICDAGGFEFAVEPGVRLDDEELSSGGATQYDRDWVLRLWRKNTGTLKTFNLAKRGTSYNSAEAMLAQNNVSKVSGLKDGREVRNAVLAAGRTAIECTLGLKPIWGEGDWTEDASDGDLQGVTDDKLANSTYHKRHVVGGDEFGDYGHVGRLWGLDCQGGYTGGYSSGGYQHDEAGFDFVTELGLNEEGSGIRTERDELLGTVVPMKWSRRIRRLQPLRSYAFANVGRDYVLEVSEDAGSTWRVIELEFRVERNLCGITLTDPRCANLATVNAGNLGTSGPIAYEDSWWKLIETQDLRFRVTAAIEADHAPLYYAARQASSGSVYPRMQVINVDVEDVWAAPATTGLGNTAWTKVAGITVDLSGDGSDPEYYTLVRAYAERRRDQLEGLRLAADAFTWLPALGQYRVGDRIVGIRGRGYSFATSAGSTSRYPNVASLTYTLAPDEQQGIRIALEDRVLQTGGTP